MYHHPTNLAADTGLRERKTASSNNAAAAASSAVDEFTWQDVAKHNTAASAWVIISGVVYDVTGKPSPS